MATRMQQRRDTAADWTSNDPTPAAGEFCWESDTNKYKIGDGSTAWTSLAYCDPKSIKLDDVTAPDDNTDLDASTSKHGLVVKATAPAANQLNVVGLVNGETAYTNKGVFDATAPEALGTAAAGTAVTAAHRDHVHQWPTALSVTSALASDGLYSGITASMTAGENLVFGEVCYLKSDGKMWKAQGNAEATMPGIAIACAAIDADAAGVFLLHGFIREDDFNWTPPNLLYVDDGVAGDMTATVADFGTGEFAQIVAQAVTADCIYFNPSFYYIEVA